MSRIPFVDLSAQHAEVAVEVQSGFAEVLAETSFVGGKQVTLFEEEYARFVGVEHCVGVANGTDALEIALRAYGVGAGDEVVIPANTFVATAEAVVRAGALPVLVDVDEATLLMDVEQVHRALSPRTRAVMPVHLYGQVVPMGDLLDLADRKGLLVIEDAAQAQGARQGGTCAGAFGAAGGTSFYPGKNLGAYGDAGAVTTRSAQVARRARMMASHGGEVRNQHEVLGFNSRLDTLQAVVLRAKLSRLEKWNDARRCAADHYRELLAGLPGLRLPAVASDNEPVWHLYVVRVARRDHVVVELERAGVGAAIHYPVPVHLHRAFEELGAGPGSFPVAEQAAGQILSLPMHPHLTSLQRQRVAEVLAAVVT